MTSDSKFIDQILDWPNLTIAWNLVQENRGSPGVDGISISRWGRNWEANLVRLREQVVTNTYRPNKPKRFLVAKKGGGVRELSILTVSDKVLQRAVLNVVDDLFEARFLGCSHGYRKNRSVATAAQQVLGARNKGYRWLLDADILDCFNSIDHQILIQLIKRVLDDWLVLNLMELWLEAGRRHPKHAVGIPMGGVISPLWCNIYLHQLDSHLSCTGWKLVRYADDFVVLVDDPSKVAAAQLATSRRLEKLKLQLHPGKTAAASFKDGFVFLGIHFVRDGYSYDYKDKRISVDGDKVKALFNKPPNFYGTAWRKTHGHPLRDGAGGKDRTGV